MPLLGKSKRKKAVEALKTQFGIDLYASGHYNNEKWMEYSVHILEGYDFVAVINRKEAGKFVAKEWYLYNKSNGWVKKASMNRQQSIQLYADTKPYYISELLDDLGGKLTPEKEESACCIICDEYISSYMTRRYFGFSIKVCGDALWKKGTSHTQAIYMPHRDPPPEKETAEEYAARMARIDGLVDQLADLIKKKDQKNNELNNGGK